MPPVFNEYDIFDDKGEVKRLVEFVVQQRDPDVSIEQMRKMDFSYVITLSKGSAMREVDLSREEINESWGWRSGNIDSRLESKIEKVIAQL
jgi:hypothetical protein